MILWQEKEENILCGNNVGNVSHQGTSVNNPLMSILGPVHRDYKLGRHVKICLINKVFSPSVLTLGMKGMLKGCCEPVIISEPSRVLSVVFISVAQHPSVAR